MGLVVQPKISFSAPLHLFASAFIFWAIWHGSDEVKIVDLSIRRPVTIFIFSVAAVVFGIVAFRNLAVNLLPDISYPSLTVRTTYEGTAVSYTHLTLPTTPY